jgi:DNA-binding CsgD family transcriptional regulator
MQNNQYINNAARNQLSILNHLPGYIIGMDPENRINYYCNAACAYILGLDSPDQAYGLKLHDVPCKVAECSDIFAQQNQRVMQERTTLKIIDIHPYRNDELKILLTHKSALINDHNQAIAALLHATEITQQSLLNITSALVNTDKKYHPRNNTEQRSYHIADTYESRLTPRESECLFYLVRGKTANLIAEMLSVSKRTVEKHIANIKIKLDCTTKANLIEKVIANNFIHYLPERFFLNANLNVSIII